jgi:alpha-mannosidase
MYWAAGVDGERVLMKWNSILVDNKHMGGYAEARDPAAVVEFVDSDRRFLARYPYRVIGAFGKGWDDLETLTDEFVHVAQEKTDANRRVIVSNQQDFFIDFHDTYGAEIPQVAVSFGNDWDLYCAALAEVSAQVKRSTEQLRTAEALATLVTTFAPDFMQGREAARDQAWMNLGLYWEHNFGLAGRDTFRNERIAWQRRLAAEIAHYVETLERDAIAAIGNVIARPDGAVRYAVFNPLNWMRTDVVDLPYEGRKLARVIDLTSGQEVPSQLVKVEGKTYLRIIAQDVPGVGYKIYEIVSGAGSEFTASVTAGENVIENEYYRLTVTETGAISSLIDKRAGHRECVQPINNLAVNDLGGASGRLFLENIGAVSATLVAVSTSPVAHTSRITLFRQIDRIDIRNTITQNFDATFGWAFSFQISQPDLWHEEVGALLLAKRVEEGGHYASQNARYDWLTLNHFADMGGAGEGMTLSNADCYFFRCGNSTADQLDTGTPQFTVLAGGRVGGDGRFGIPNQGGDMQFLQRFALRSRPSYDTAAAMRFALEHQNPLVAIRVTGEQAKRSDSQFSLCSLLNPNVIVWALKPADDIGGTVIRLWNMASTPQHFDLSLQDIPIRNAFRVTHIETILEPVQVTEGGVLSGELGAFQMRTYAINVDAAS